MFKMDFSPSPGLSNIKSQFVGYQGVLSGV